MKKLIYFALFFLTISSCFAQNKTLPKIKKPIRSVVREPPMIKDVDRSKMKKDTVLIAPGTVKAAAPMGIDFGNEKATVHDNGFNKYSNNKVFTEDDILLSNPIKKVAETDRIGKDALLIYGGNGTVISFDLKQQTTNWTYAERGIERSGGNKFSVDHATLYVPYTNGTIAALNVNTGLVNWKDKIGHRSDKTTLTRQNAIVAKGLVFVAARNSDVYAINKINGALVWNYRLNYEYNIYPPVVAGDDVFFNSAPYLYKFEAQTGKAIWQRAFNKAMYAKMVADEKHLYATDESNKLSAVNPAGNSVIDWEFNLLDNQYGVEENIILNNGAIYLAGKANPDSKASSIYAISAADGKQLWKTDLPKNEITNISLIDGQIYGYMKDSFFIIDTKDGKQLLDVKPEEEPVSNFISETADTVLYLSSNGIVRYNKLNKHFTLIPIGQLKTSNADDKATIQLVTKQN